MTKANYHTHSTFCDGADTPEQIADYAFRTGMTHLGFSGHMDADLHMDIARYYREIRRLQKAYEGKMDILRGIELDTLYDPACAYDAEYIIGSTHFLDVDSPIPMSVDASAAQMQKLCAEYYAGDYYSLARSYYELEHSVYDRTGCTFVGHFDLVTRFNDELHFLDEEDPRYLNCALEAMEYLAGQGIPFEINCGAVNRGRKKELYPCMRLLKALHDFGGEILINSDAHQKELLCGAFDQAAEAALSCGFTYVNILEHDRNGHVVMRKTALS